MATDVTTYKHVHVYAWMHGFGYSCYMYLVHMCIPVVDILDWNECCLVVPGQHIDGGRAPVVVVHIDHINGS